MYEPHKKNKLQRAATLKSKNTNLFAIYILFGTTWKSNTVPHASYHSSNYNISTLCNRNKKYKTNV